MFTEVLKIFNQEGHSPLSSIFRNNGNPNDSDNPNDNGNPNGDEDPHHPFNISNIDPNRNANPNEDEDPHYPFNISNIDHHGGHAEFQ